LITADEGPAKAVAPPAIQGAGPIRSENFLATWRSGYAAACKAVYTGSIPVVASMRYAC
jgi:hypothetical protein